MPIPVRLKTPTIVDAIVELRFEPAGSNVQELLPGLLYGALKEKLVPGVAALPFAQIPDSVRDADDQLKYQPTHCLTSTTGRLTIGRRVVGVARTGRYPGWATFQPEVASVHRILRDTGLAKRLERLSYRCINLIAADEGRQLKRLRLSVAVADKAASEFGFQLRTELHDDHAAVVTQVSTNASVSGPNVAPISGILVDIDAISKDTALSWDTLEDALELIHQRQKQAFFELLTVETINSLGPEY